MKAAKWREFSEDELLQKARELNEEIFNLRFQLSMGVAKNPSRLGQARRDLRGRRPVLRERKGGRAPVGERKRPRGCGGVATRMQKTRVVRIERVFRHPRYQRVIRMSKKLKAHDENNESRVGDRVLIEETRPLSKEKRWRIRKVLSRVS